MPDPIRTENDALIEAARKGQQTTIEGPNDFITPFAHNPAWGNQTLDLEKFLEAPTRKRGQFYALTSDAFIDYIQLHRTNGTLITGLMTEKDGSFRAELDHHNPNRIDFGAKEQPTVTITEGIPSWRTHHALLELRLTPEWMRWLGNNAKVLDQGTFAEFIEDNAPDITVPENSRMPDSATMMTVATTLEAKTNVEFSSGVRLQNGTQQLTYNEVVNGQAGGEAKLAIPERFALALAPFVGAPRYLLTARLRYYLSRGKVTFKYEFERPHKVIEDAFKAEAAKIATALGLPVLLGQFKGN
jgi:uncharacterized protein YfdQ (DUF2303 family)